MRVFYDLKGNIRKGVKKEYQCSQLCPTDRSTNNTQLIKGGEKKNKGGFLTEGTLASASHKAHQIRKAARF